MAETTAEVRIERDSMGEIEVPAHALWGASTQRAVLNFPISGERFPREFLEALGLIKLAAAFANAELGVLDAVRARAIAAAAREVASGALDAHFPVDVFQTGSGTSTNTNANEVIARRANDALGAAAPRVHPNDHVNASQSSNDVMPSALHVAGRLAIVRDLAPALGELSAALREKARELADVVKIGRTHLMDATPIRLDQELGAWARQIEQARARVLVAAEDLGELALGGTAVGTGINCPPGFARLALARLGDETGLVWREASDHFEAQAARDAAVAASGALRGTAIALSKIANDVRLLASGPHCGIGELRLPAVQPGSSIMPGKVNPVIPEAVVQAAAQVLGNDHAIALGGLGGQLQLNATIPLIAHNLLGSIRLLANAARVFARSAIRGLTADRERAENAIEGSLAMVTALAPRIGYDRAAEIAKAAAESGRTVREICAERGVLPPDELERLLDPRSMTGR